METSLSLSKYNGHENNGGSSYDLYAKIYDETGALVNDIGQVNNLCLEIRISRTLLKLMTGFYYRI